MVGTFFFQGTQSPSFSRLTSKSIILSHPGSLGGKEIGEIWLISSLYTYLSLNVIDPEKPQQIENSVQFSIYFLSTSLSKGISE